MAFPAIDATSQQASFTVKTSHPITMPACSAGKYLLAGVFIDTDATITTGWGCWTQIVNATDYTGAIAQVEHRYKVAGSGADTLTLETSGSVRLAYIIRCLSGASGNFEASTIATGISVSPDSGSVTPSWGAKDSLWITFAAYDALTSNANVTAFPTNYDDNQLDNTDGATVGYAQATRNLNATTDDPGAFTLDAGDSWVAGVIVVEPSASDASASRMMRGFI